MITARFFVMCSLCCMAVPLAVASGQRESKAVIDSLPLSPGKPNLDLSIELWGGRADGKIFNNAGGYTGVAMSSLRIRNFSHGALIAGAGAGVQKLLIPGGDKCILVPGVPGCAPDFPAFSWLMAHVGVEGRWAGPVRIIAGPAAFRSASGTVAGFQGRADLAAPTFAHLALVVSARGALLPRFQGRRYEMAAMGIGVRVGS